MAGHTYHDNPLRALPLQAEAYRGCMRCSGKPSNRTKLPDTMGNRRHSPTPGLPNLVATSLGSGLWLVSEARRDWELSASTAQGRRRNRKQKNTHKSNMCFRVSHPVLGVEG